MPAPSAALGQLPCDRLADPTARPRDDRDFSLNVHGLPPRSRNVSPNALQTDADYRGINAGEQANIAFALIERPWPACEPLLEKSTIVGR